MKRQWLHDLLHDLKQLAYESAAQLLFGLLLFGILGLIAFVASAMFG